MFIQLVRLKCGKGMTLNKQNILQRKSTTNFFYQSFGQTDSSQKSVSMSHTWDSQSDPTDNWLNDQISLEKPLFMGYLNYYQQTIVYFLQKFK